MGFVVRPRFIFEAGILVPPACLVVFYDNFRFFVTEVYKLVMILLGFCDGVYVRLDVFDFLSLARLWFWLCSFGVFARPHYVFIVLGNL